MKKINLPGQIKKFFAHIYFQLFKIDDSAQKVALGFGIGVFLGVFPGTGPLAALFCAWLFRLNRASALLGSLLTNTWISLVIFLLAVKAGSAVMRVGWQEVHKAGLDLIKDFHWAKLWSVSIGKIALPLLIGYTLIGLVLGLLAYLITLILLTRLRNAPKS
jgi:uncharacterized protein (DUF2062 family)